MYKYINKTAWHFPPPSFVFDSYDQIYWYRFYTGTNVPFLNTRNTILIIYIFNREYLVTSAKFNGIFLSVQLDNIATD